MAALNTDYFTHVGSPGTATTLSAPGYTIGNTTITVGSTTNWSTDTGVIFAIDTVTTVNGVQVRDIGSYTEWEGVVTSSTDIGNLVLRYGTDQNYPAGSTTRVYIPVSSSRENRLADGILVSHNQDGTIKTNTIDNSHVKTGAAIDGSKLAASSVGSTQLSLGVPVQMVSTNFSAVNTGTTILPFDDTIPQNTEGTEFMTQAITPKSATNILVIEGFIYLSTSIVVEACVALFQDSSANALAATSATVTGNTYIVCIPICHTMIAGTTSSTTFKFRAGPANAATITFNGTAAARRFGAITKSSVIITEYKAS